MTEDTLFLDRIDFFKKPILRKMIKTVWEVMMNRKYVMICSFFLAFMVLTVICYSSYRYANRQEKEEEIQSETAQTGGNKEQRVTSDTRYIVEKYEEESEELVKEERAVPASYAGLTRQELEHQLAVELATMSWEEEKAGLVKISLESFSAEKIVIRKVYNKSGEQGFILKLEDGEVVVYRVDEDEPYEKTGLMEDSLSAEDKKLLKDGYAVQTEKELYSVLENFSS